MGPYARISFYYVTQFLPAGAAHAYAGIWLASNGLSSFEISVVTTVPIVLILASNVFVGRLADGARDWRSSLQILSLVFLIFITGLFWADSFWPILLCFTGATVAGALAAPIGDAAALHLTSQGRGHIGTLRGLATTGYMLALFMTGYAAESFGSIAFIILSLGFALFRLFASMILPTFKTSEEVTAPQLRTGYRALLKPHLFWPLASWSISYATILALNSYLALHLMQGGYDAKAISWLIAIGAFTEVLMFFAFRKFEHLLDLRTFIAISCGTAVLRWLLMATSPGLSVLVILQASHGISYALGFVACISFIRRNTTSAEAAEVQSFFNVMQQIAAVIFITAFGTAFDDWGANTFLLSAVGAGLGCLIILAAMYMQRETG
jgi:PPP family 3-phenylpropionic acid transporter